MTANPIERKAKYTVDDLLAMPDDGKRYELSNGEIVEVGTSNRKHTVLGAWFVQMLRNYVQAQKLGGDVSGADGTYELDEINTKVPDAAYVSREKVATLTDETVYYPFAPDLAVEIKSPSNSVDEMKALAELYLQSGTRLVWTIDPLAKTAIIYHVGQPPIALDRTGELVGYEVLPGLHLSLNELFSEIDG